MDEVTQRDASLVELAASATKGLEQQGGKLMEALTVFRLKDKHIEASSQAPKAKKPPQQKNEQSGLRRGTVNSVLMQ